LLRRFRGRLDLVAVAIKEFCRPLTVIGISGNIAERMGLVEFGSRFLPRGIAMMTCDDEAFDGGRAD